MGFLQVTSFIATLICGMLIFICWLIAAHDNKFLKGECGGCIEKLNDALSGKSGSLMRYYQNSKDGYNLLVAFGVICGVFWIVDAIFAWIKIKIHLIIGGITQIIFVVIFAILVERLRNNRPCTYYGEVLQLTGISPWTAAGCKTSDNWETKHQFDSYEMFWGSSVIIFLLSCYHLAAATALVVEEERELAKGEKKEEKKEEKAGEPQKEKTEGPKEVVSEKPAEGPVAERTKKEETTKGEAKPDEKKKEEETKGKAEPGTAPPPATGPKEEKKGAVAPPPTKEEKKQGAAPVPAKPEDKKAPIKEEAHKGANGKKEETKGVTKPEEKKAAAKEEKKQAGKAAVKKDPGLLPPSDSPLPSEEESFGGGPAF